MKNLITFFIALFCIITTTNAQWTSLNAPGSSTGDSYDYNKLAVSDNGKNIAAYCLKITASPITVTQKYVISNNYGSTWSEQAAPSSQPNQLFWQDDVLYVADVLTTAFKKSTDFGATWTVQYDSLYNIGLANNIIRLSNNYWIVLKKISNQDHILFSTDNGASWTDRGLVAGAFPVFFSNVIANNGNLVTISGGGVAYSSDSGLNWSNSTLPTTIQITDRHTFSKAPNGDIYMYVHLYGIFKSSDNGVSFQDINTTLPTNASNCAFQDADLICLSTDAATYKSTNNGASFSPLTPANQLYPGGGLFTKILEKSKEGLYTSGKNSIYRYGSAPNAVSSIAKRSDLSVSPNPAVNALTINGNTLDKDETVTIYNVYGKKISQLKYSNNSLDISALLPGVYFATVTNKGNNFIGNFKFIKN